MKFYRLRAWHPDLVAIGVNTFVPTNGLAVPTRGRNVFSMIWGGDSAVLVLVAPLQWGWSWPSRRLRHQREDPKVLPAQTTPEKLDALKAAR